MEHQWNEIYRGKPTTRGETCPSATLSTTNLTWTDPGSNPGLRGERPATNRLSHGTTFTAKLLLKTTTVRYRPLRLIHWWTRFVTLSITCSWQALLHLFLQKFLVWDCVSLPNVHDTIFFSNSPITINHKPTDRANGLARKCLHKRRYFRKRL
jgi:hypothetical protein